MCSLDSSTSNYKENLVILILIQRKNGNTAERNPVVSTQDQILQGQCWGWAGWLKQMWIAAEIEGMSEGKIFLETLRIFKYMDMEWWLSTPEILLCK